MKLNSTFPLLIDPLTEVPKKLISFNSKIDGEKKKEGERTREREKRRRMVIFDPKLLKISHSFVCSTSNK